ncbi:uncharacterized protein LOC111519233 [Drosophila willistoni]|uniref:uncharacterized protein LOC111519233 n=1 Tax=Drosophila willistoni TaxID=7260 RepID=UPI000C26D847|nr:uncharacterized protein LOC111519233 [Drosophila willistoni]
MVQMQPVDIENKHVAVTSVKGLDHRKGRVQATVMHQLQANVPLLIVPLVMIREPHHNVVRLVGLNHVAVKHVLNRQTRQNLQTPFPFPVTQRMRGHLTRIRGHLTVGMTEMGPKDSK